MEIKRIRTWQLGVTGLRLSPTKSEDLPVVGVDVFRLKVSLINDQAQSRALARRLERFLGSNFLGARRTTSWPEEI
ncbi:MAG: hypothetical protein ABSB22_10090 [Thermodesulfobacteriota bacterium]